MQREVDKLETVAWAVFVCSVLGMVVVCLMVLFA